MEYTPIKTVFHSESLILRPVTPEDVTHTYVAWMNEPEVNKYMETRFREQTREAVESYVGTAIKNPDLHFFAILDPVSGKHIGNIKLAVNPHHRRGEISLFIGEKDFWGRGLATEAIKMISDHGFNELRLRKITAGCYSNNKGSARAFEKAGFSREAVLSKEYLCSGRPVDRWCYCRFPGGNVQ